MHSGREGAAASSGQPRNTGFSCCLKGAVHPPSLSPRSGYSEAQRVGQFPAVAGADGPLVAPQSVVAGSWMVTSPVPCGFTVMSQEMLLGWSVLCALSTDPPVTLKASNFRVAIAQAELLAELDLEGELRRSVVGGRGRDLQPDGERLRRRCHCRSSNAGQGFGVAGIVGESHPHLDGLSLLAGSQGVAGSGGPVDVRSRRPATGSYRKRWSARPRRLLPRCPPSASPPPGASRRWWARRWPGCWDQPVRGCPARPPHPAREG